MNMMTKAPRSRVAWRRLLYAAATTIGAAGCVSSGDPSDQSATYAQAAGVRDNPESTGYVINQAGDLTVVDCLLPGKLRKMGKTVTWVTRPRPVKKTASDCEILGGQYVLFDRANYDTALAVWMVSAKEGDPTAQTYVGEIYERGLGRAPDYAEAANWYRKAADQGFARAQLRLGTLYEKGLGVSRDSVSALNWYRKAAGISKDRLVYLSQAVAISSRRQTSAGPAPRASVVQAEVARIEAETKSRDAKLARTESEVAQAKQQVVISSRKTRLIDQTAPSVQPNRRLIDQYVALTQQAETQRIARDGLRKVLDVSQPLLASR